MNLHVERTGQGANLVLLHGWGLHSGVWTEVLPALSARYQVHAIDLPGHGLSAAASVGTLDEAVDSIAALVPGRSHICGWSLGGLVAQRLAQLHPGKVHSLVLASTSPCFMQRTDWPEAMRASTLDEFATGLHCDREATLVSFVRLNALNGAHGREAIRALTARLFERGAPSEAALRATLEWLRETDLRAQAAQLPRRTLVLHGARDALAPVAAGEWLAANIPGAAIQQWPDAAHIPFFTHREPFVGALESFLG
ncbi:MAG: pimeloyl-ACP methyl ester esterase BioH [Usitatibacter sp.]